MPLITPQSETEWQALYQAMGELDWTREERFATRRAREQHADGIGRSDGGLDRHTDAARDGALVSF